jgi:Flp pilus assembly protein TadG
MRRNCRSIVRAQDGTALVELALVLPLLLVVLFGLIELGRYGSTSLIIGNAARAGVQYGAQNYVTAADFAGMQTRAQTDAQNLAGFSATASNFCTCADGTASTCQKGDCASSHRNLFVQVVVTCAVPSLLGYSGLPAALSTITVKQTAVMRVSQ